MTTRRDLLTMGTGLALGAHFPPLPRIGNDGRVDDLETLSQFITGVWFVKMLATAQNVTVTTSETVYATDTVTGIPTWASKMALIALAHFQLTESTSTQNAFLQVRIEGTDYASREQTMANGETGTVSTGTIQVFDRPADGQVALSLIANTNDHNSTANAGSVYGLLVGIRPSPALEAIT